MITSEGKLGRVFMIRLEEGDLAAESIERFVAEKGISSAQVFLVGDEAVAGIVAPDLHGNPVLRMPERGTDGRDVWKESEIVIQEVLGINFRRVVAPDGRHTLARVSSTKTRVMEKAAPTPEESGPGTIPVYLFNAEFN